MDTKPEMQLGWKVRLVLALTALAVAAAIGQPVPGAVVGAGSAPQRAAADVDLEPVPLGAVYREIDDPNTGIHWLLVRETGHPGGPGRLVPVWRGTAGISAAGSATKPARPVIRTGDHLLVEESTAVVEAHLEGSALGTAAVGAPLAVRLTMGGRVVTAVALGPGRAALEGEAHR